MENTIHPNAYNNLQCYRMDSLTQSFCRITVSNMGMPRIETENPDDKIYIEEYIKNMNGFAESFQDFAYNVWVDNINHGFHLSVPLLPSKPGYPFKNELMRVPPETIQIVYDPNRSWRKFVQSTYMPPAYANYNDFLLTNFQYGAGNTNIVVIPDDPQHSLFVKLFDIPPMDSIAHFIVYKRWIYWFMRKFAEKLWAPTRTAFVGDPKTTRYPESDDEMNDAIEAVDHILVRLRNFSTATFPGIVRLETQEIKNNGDIYLKVIDTLNKEIMWGLYSSIAVRDESSTYKGNEKPDETYVQFMETVRQEIGNCFVKHLCANIVPHLKPNQIRLKFPLMRSNSLKEYVQAYKVACDNAIFKDSKERRLIMNSVFPELQDTEITDEEMAKMDALYKEMRSPSQPKGSTSSGTDTTNPEA